MKLITKYMKPYFWIALLGVTFVASSALLELYQIRLMGTIIDVGIANSDMPLILNVGFQMMGCALIGIVISVLGLVIPTNVTTRVAHKLRTDLFAKIQEFSMKNINN